ncbi:hypothetical protein ABZ845_25965 [Streptomyces sp. NPDC047022]|uniref:WXG100 family type VII secretion target n=1 Tax=Streptomyces sp. NPDC047022 TaxID=3155737 RepID=UPI0033C09A71
MGTGNPTYQDVVTIDLDALITAAKDWDDMAHTFDDLGRLYGAKVESIANDGSWAGVSRGVAYTRFTSTRKQFTDAHTEAQAIASLLRTAHERFSQRIGHVKNLVEQAEKDEMTVNGIGEAVYDFRKLTPMRHDPDYPKYVTQVKDAEAAWTKKIKDAVRAVDDEDQVVSRALREAAGVGSFLEQMLETLGQGQNFNGAAVGDLTTYEKEVKKEEAEQRAEAERKKKHDGTVKAIYHGIAKGLSIFNGEPGPDLGSKFIGTLIDGVAGATGYNKTQGITIGVGAGWGGGGIGYSITLAETQTPDGKTQIGILTSKSVHSSGVDFGLSATAGKFYSNADDIGQLEGKGWDKGGSAKFGLGLYGNHQTEIGTTNSKGEGVNVIEYGLGAGLGAEIGGGYSDAKSRWQTEIGSDKK